MKAVLIIWSGGPPALEQVTAGIDVSDARSTGDKAHGLRSASFLTSLQSDFLKNPMTILTLDSRVRSERLLQDFANSLGGITSGDSPRFRRGFWEIPMLPTGWVRQQLTPPQTAPFTGRSAILDLEGVLKAAERGEGTTIAGGGAWGRPGVAVRYTGDLPVTRYEGEYFENVIAVIVPHSSKDRPAIWHFCCSREFGESVRRLDQTIGVKEVRGIG